MQLLGQHQHPGTIRMIDEFDNSIVIVKAEDVPDHQRFVFFDSAGIEVGSEDNATERIPVEEVRMTPLDGDGNLVPKHRAKLIRIKEYGPDKRLLRSTSMTANRPPVAP